MPKKLLIVLFLVPYFALLSWAIYLYFQLHAGVDVKVAIQGYDPRHLLAGRYVEYMVDWEKTDCSQFENSVCPKEEFCEKVRYNSDVRLCRFYINEDMADRLQRILWNNGKDLNLEAVFSYKNGSKPLAKQMLINGKDWREFVKKEEATH